MTLYQKIMKIAKCGKMPVLQDKDKQYCILSTPDGDGDLRMSLWCYTIERCMETIGDDCGCNKDAINSSDWTIVKTIDFASLGEGYEVGEKVRILPNAKEECGKTECGWDKKREEIANKGYGIISGIAGADYLLKSEDGYCRVFSRTCLEPYFEDEVKETIKIGESVYDKKEFEEAVKDLKKLNQ